MTKLLFLNFLSNSRRRPLKILAIGLHCELHVSSVVRVSPLNHRHISSVDYLMLSQSMVSSAVLYFSIFHPIVLRWACNVYVSWVGYLTEHGCLCSPHSIDTPEVALELSSRLMADFESTSDEEYSSVSESSLRT